MYITTPIRPFMFASEVNTIVIEFDDGDADVTKPQVVIYADGEPILNETYYVYNSHVILTDLMDLFNLYATAATQIEIKCEGGTLANFYLHYCNVQLLQIQGDEFIKANFLRTDEVSTITKDLIETVFFIKYPGETGQLKITAIVDDMAVTIKDEAYSNDSELYVSAQETIVLPTLISYIAQKLGSDACLSAVSISAGERLITFLISDISNEIFSFTNEFNVIQSVCFAAKTTRKSKASLSIAEASKALSLYNRSLEETFEVSAENLPLELALNLAKIQCAQHVYNADDLDVLIVDSTIELHDDDSELNTVKFTYRFNTANKALTTALHSSRFSEQFSPTFF